MHIISWLFLASFLVFIVAAGVALFAPPKLIAPVCTAAQATGALLILAISILTISEPSQWHLGNPFAFGNVPIGFKADALNSWFLALLSVVSISVAIFAPAYLKTHSEHLHSRLFWFCLSLFILSLQGVFLADNVLTLLVFWELMSFTSGALVVTDTSSRKAQKAAIVYFGATRMATSLLGAGFLWLFSITHSWSLSEMHFRLPEMLGPAILITLGCCIKAGVWPFHIWLPYAHPCAPAPVSALMSGIMIKVPIYLLCRLVLSASGDLLPLAILLFALGVISSFWGAIFAVVQSEYKQLLAYSSVENIGLMITALAVACLGISFNLPQLEALGLIAALLHAFNHGLFKSLLFLSAGTIDSSTHMLNLEQLGGLHNKLPKTMFCFLIGALAICAFPPLNGFASKWLIYQSLFSMALNSPNKLFAGSAFIAMGTFALVGALSLMAFSKAFGVAFLGRPRSKAAEHAKESAPSMVVAQALLVAACLGSAFFTTVLANHLGAQLFAQNLPLPSLPMPLLCTSMLSIAIICYVVASSTSPRRASTWECGYGDLSKRMQVSSRSYAHTIELLFSTLVRFVETLSIGGQDRRHFPEQIKSHTVQSSLLEVWIYGPLIHMIRIISQYLSKLQAGSIHLYLIYVFVTLIVLLVVGTKT